MTPTFGGQDPLQENLNLNQDHPGIFRIRTHNNRIREGLENDTSPWISTILKTHLPTVVPQEDLGLQVRPACQVHLSSYVFFGDCKGSWRRVTSLVLNPILYLVTCLDFEIAFNDVFVYLSLLFIQIQIPDLSHLDLVRYFNTFVVTKIFLLFLTNDNLNEQLFTYAIRLW